MEHSWESLPSYYENRLKGKMREVEEASRDNSGKCGKIREVVGKVEGLWRQGLLQQAGGEVTAKNIDVHKVRNLMKQFIMYD